MVQRRIPVVVLAGFLGSGKTSLLNHLLRNPRGARIGVVVNDFGSLNIDALNVAGQVDSSVALGNGCLCCAVDPAGLDGMLAKLTRPESDLDAVVIESSGLADPRGVVRLLLNSADPRASYGGLVEVVDCAEFETTRPQHPELDEHLRFADLVVLNKTDRVADRTGTETLVRELAAGSPVLPTSHGRIDPGLLFDADALRDRRGAPGQLSFDQLLAESGPEHEHAHTGYDSVSFETDRPLHPRELVRFLDDRPHGVFRMKGWVHFDLPGYREKYSLHTVGNFLRFGKQRWQAGETRGTKLVAIGTGLDERTVQQRLSGCVGSPPDGDEHAMLNVLRYLR